VGANGYADRHETRSVSSPEAVIICTHTQGFQLPVKGFAHSGSYAFTVRSRGTVLMRETSGKIGSRRGIHKLQVAGARTVLHASQIRNAQDHLFIILQDARLA
jgi:hypothetical protein